MHVIVAVLRCLIEACQAERMRWVVHGLVFFEIFYLSWGWCFGLDGNVVDNVYLPWVFCESYWDSQGLDLFVLDWSFRRRGEGAVSSCLDGVTLDLFLLVLPWLFILGSFSREALDCILGSWSLNDVAAIVSCRLHIKQALSGIIFADKEDPGLEWVEYKSKRPTCSLSINISRWT